MQTNQHCPIVQTPGAPAHSQKNENMKTAIKLTAIAAALACGAIASHASFAQAPAQQTQGAGIVTEQRQVGAFSAIELAGPYRVVIDAQARQAVQVSGERKQLDEMEVAVRGDTLVVRPLQRTGFSFNFGKRRDIIPTVTIGAAGLKSLKMSGSGDVELEQVNGDRFVLVNSGPGDLHASGAVRRLAVESSGSGDLDLRRMKAGDADIDMHGPGDVRLAGIGSDAGSQPGAQLNVQLSGSGDLSADGLRLARVTARLRGPGNLKLAGASRELSLESSGSGDFEGCGLAVEGAHSVLRGPGNACIAGNIRKFDAEVHGSGELSARGLQAASAQVRLGGPGNAELAGSIGDLTAEVSGSGDLNGEDLKVRKAIVRSRGPGGVKLQNVSDTLDAELHGPGELAASMSGKRLLLRMSGPGDARIDGSVDQVSAQISGSGSLEGRRLNVGQADIAVRGPGSAAVNLIGNDNNGSGDKGKGRAAVERGQLLLVDRSGSHRTAD
jgi:hypothetical protein